VTHYLIRHAHAVPDEENPIRPLSEWGRKQVAALCLSLRATSFKPAEIWHSPLARSRETAALLAAGMGLSAKVEEKDGLQPGDDPREVAKALSKERREIAVVGHEPHLGILAGLMVNDGHPGASFDFPKAGALALHQVGPRWHGKWIGRRP
jgi:phosphohistidine phosphatase